MLGKIHLLMAFEGKVFRASGVVLGRDWEVRSMMIIIYFKYSIRTFTIYT